MREIVGFEWENPPVGRPHVLPLPTAVIAVLFGLRHNMPDEVLVYHIRKLADFNRPDRPDEPAWVYLMAKRRRKTLVVCRACHEDIHAGRTHASTRNRPLESRVLRK